MASLSSSTINSLMYIYLNRDSPRTSSRLMRRAYTNLKHPGITILAEAEKEMADRKFATEHPEFGEVCL